MLTVDVLSQKAGVAPLVEMWGDNPSIFKCLCSNLNGKLQVPLNHYQVPTVEIHHSDRIALAIVFST